MLEQRHLAGKSTEHMSSVVRTVITVDPVLICNPRKKADQNGCNIDVKMHTHNT